MNHCSQNMSVIYKMYKQTANIAKVTLLRVMLGALVISEVIEMVYLCIPFGLLLSSVGGRDIRHEQADNPNLVLLDCMIVVYCLLLKVKVTFEFGVPYPNIAAD